ncbi:hypothetical protein [Rathayibacter sp. SD072]|uniref:hypothetical protein n=1 Tax=Rathayibacter sp. SD072 TaxID=2781731 RepID=UPI001A9602B7|nr:hypothetical protein [Rathayibacter sp. SD072]MBO0982808.1 hypothetical protein [Rathayibacter sp. SD072]
MERTIIDTDRLPRAQAPDEERSGGSRWASREAIGRRSRAVVSRGSHLWPLLVLAAATTILWGRTALRDFGNLRLSNAGDSETFVYDLQWNVHALLTGQDLFLTPNLYAPTGLDLGNAISLPSVSILVAPVSLLFGGTTAYNVAFLLAIFLAAASVYLLARELTGSSIGSTLAGLLTVMSPYFTAHSLSHMNLMWIFGLPFLAYLTARYVRGRLHAALYTALIGLTIGFTAGASTELLMTSAVFGLVIYLVALVFVQPRWRSRLLRAFLWIVAGGLVGAVLSLPVVFAALRSGIPATPGNPPELYSTELTNLLVPTRLFAFGESYFQPVWPLWVGNDAENSAYIPLTLIALLAVTLLLVRNRSTGGLVVFAVIALVFSFGPYLTVAGRATVPLPWIYTKEIVGIDHALPSRFSAFVFFALAVLVAVAWAELPRLRVLTAALVAGSLVLLQPSFAVLGFPVSTEPDEFVTSGSISDFVEPGDNVLVLPSGQNGPGMRWVAEEDFSFSMPTGGGGGAIKPPALDTPIGDALWRQDLGFDYAAALPSFIDEYGIDAIIVDDDHPEWVPVMENALGVAPVVEDGASVWELDSPSR